MNPINWVKELFGKGEVKDPTSDFARTKKPRPSSKSSKDSLSSLSSTDSSAKKKGVIAQKSFSDNSEAFLEEIVLFQREAIQVLTEHLMQTEYSKHSALMREIRYLVKNVFSVLEDDYFVGHRILKKRMTKLDDYIFSQHRKNPDLKPNMDKLIKVAFTKRFTPDPRDNLLSYFVFIEELNFEIIYLLQDFYALMETAETRPDLFEKYRSDYSLQNYRGTEEDVATRQTMEPTLFANSAASRAPKRKELILFDDLTSNTRR